MNPKIAAPVPEAIAQLQRQLDQFRATRPARTKLPESLWQAAVELARQHGIYTVAHPLRLDYTRLEAATGRNAEPAKKTEQIRVCRTDRGRRGSLARVRHRV